MYEIPLFAAVSLVASQDGENHVHWLSLYPIALAPWLILLGVSLTMRSERPDLNKRYWKGVLWSPSYFAASCGGAPINILKAYIEQQKTPV